MRQQVQSLHRNERSLPRPDEKNRWKISVQKFAEAFLPRIISALSLSIIKRADSYGQAALFSKNLTIK